MAFSDTSMTVSGSAVLASTDMDNFCRKSLHIYAISYHMLSELQCNFTYCKVFM